MAVKFMVLWHHHVIGRVDEKLVDSSSDVVECEPAALNGWMDGKKEAHKSKPVTRGQLPTRIVAHQIIVVS